MQSTEQAQTFDCETCGDTFDVATIPQSRRCRTCRPVLVIYTDQEGAPEGREAMEAWATSREGGYRDVLWIEEWEFGSEVARRDWRSEDYHIPTEADTLHWPDEVWG